MRKAFLFWAGLQLLGSAGATAAEPMRAFYVGHSLESDIPDIVLALAQDAKVPFSFKDQFNPGASLRHQWGDGRKVEAGPFSGGYDQVLPGGNYDVLVVTDSVPRGGREQEAETAEFLAKFHAYALEQNPKCRVYYYETWSHTTSGTPENYEHDTASPRRTLRWRERLDADRTMWEEIVASANRSNAGKGEPIRIIPAGQALGRFDDVVKKGEVDGMKDTKDFFGDTIHLNPCGKYLVACVHFAVLTGRSPEGLTGDVKDRWGRSYWNTPTWDKKVWPRPSDKAIASMQRIAWETVQGGK